MPGNFDDVAFAFAKDFGISAAPEPLVDGAFEAVESASDGGVIL